MSLKECRRELILTWLIFFPPQKLKKCKQLAVLNTEGPELEKLLYFNLSAFPALWPAVTSNAVRWNGLKHFRNQHTPFRAIKIITPARREEGENQTLQVPKSCPDLKHTWSQLRLNNGGIYGELSKLLRVLPKCFCLEPLPDAFMSDGYFLGSKSGDYVIFEIMSLLLAYLGFMWCLGEMPNPIFLTWNGAVVFSPFFVASQDQNAH